MATTIEQFAPELEKIVATSEPIRALADGFGGPQGPAEGPLWWKEGRYLLFSDIHNNKRMKYVPGQGVSLFLEPTNRANGLTRDLQGRLLACEHDTRRVDDVAARFHRDVGTIESLLRDPALHLGLVETRNNLPAARRRELGDRMAHLSHADNGDALRHDDTSSKNAA